MKTKVLAVLVMASLLMSAVVSAMAGSSDKYDLSNFGYRYVESRGRGSLVFQRAPRGKSMKGHKFYDGDRIYVNLRWRESGYGIAYENGEYGYVDASYIDWGTDENDRRPSPPDRSGSNWKLDYIGDLYVVNCNDWVSLRERADSSSYRLAKVPLGARVTDVYDTIYGFYYCRYNGQTGFIQKQYLSSYRQERRSDSSRSRSVDQYDLSQYGYRRVSSKGRGKLVFQKSPRGAFMSNHKFYDGDMIYVNLNWRSQGYAMAYEDGEYGYVDASYIDWNR